MPEITSEADDDLDELLHRVLLEGHETRFRYLVYVADREVNNWTRYCIRQADEVVALGSGSAESAGMTEVEAEVLRQEDFRRVKPRSALILVHPPGTRRPNDTGAWLKDRRIDRHFHIRAGSRADLDRIVRYVTNRETGLVLSGGGSRGFAHMGVIKAIREAAIPIDIVTGVSMGAVVGALWALGEDLDRVLAPVKTGLSHAFKDYTLPIVALNRGRKFDLCLQSLYGDARIEDLWKPYYCVSSNLTRADSVQHRAGSLWRAVRASSSLPGRVPPVVRDGELLMDGCLMNNLPIDLMREDVRSGTVIAVDVVPPVDLEIRASDVDSPSGWRIIASRLNPFGKSLEMPRIVSILQRAGELPSLQNRRQRIAADLADLYVRPPVQQFEILDFSAAEAAVEIGYEHAAKEIAGWVDRRSERGQGHNAAID